MVHPLFRADSSSVGFHPIASVPSSGSSSRHERDSDGKQGEAVTKRESRRSFVIVTDLMAILRSGPTDAASHGTSFPLTDNPLLVTREAGVGPTLPLLGLSRMNSKLERVARSDLQRRSDRVALTRHVGTRAATAGRRGKTCRLTAGRSYRESPIRMG